jgi:uncharacterized protein YigE (DUF2233 family)
VVAAAAVAVVTAAAAVMVAAVVATAAEAEVTAVVAGADAATAASGADANASQIFQQKRLGKPWRFFVRQETNRRSAEQRITSTAGMKQADCG